jgi:hypothetical protein
VRVRAMREPRWQPRSSSTPVKKEHHWSTTHPMTRWNSAYNESHSLDALVRHGESNHIDAVAPAPANSDSLFLGAAVATPGVEGQ